MSLHEYRESQKASSEYDFYALIMAAMRNADDNNLAGLRAIFPKTYSELIKRYNAPGGLLENEDG